MIAFQIRSLRDAKEWTQGQFAEQLGMKYSNNVSARLENPNYGKQTITTLKNIAKTCDVGLVVWFVPFGRLIDWATCTPYQDSGLTPDFYNIPSFSQEFGMDLAGLGRVPETDKADNPMPLGSIGDDDHSGAMRNAA